MTVTLPTPTTTSRADELHAERQEALARIHRAIPTPVLKLQETAEFHGCACTEFVGAEGPAGYIVYFSPLVAERMRLGRSVRFRTPAEAEQLLHKFALLRDGYPCSCGRSYSTTGERTVCDAMHAMSD